MTMEAVVLAGGLGTRLDSVLQHTPKALAPVAGRPFLEVLLKRLHTSGVTRVILSVGYLGGMIVDHFGEEFQGLELSYSVETEPLGTGGATRKSLDMAVSNSVLVLNGDTMVDVDYSTMLRRHIELGASVSVALTQVADTARYGRVVVNGDRIVDFAEKSARGAGQINAGVYGLNRDLFTACPMPDVFSLERDFLVPYVRELQPLAFETSGYFIDIGTPEDLSRAQVELSGL